MTDGFWRSRYALPCSCLRCGRNGEVTSCKPELRTSFCWLLPLRCSGWRTTQSSIAIRWNLPTARTQPGPLNREARPCRIPASHDLRTAFSYFLKSAELNLAAENLAEALDCLLALAGRDRLHGPRPEPKLWPLLLLWIPVPFYVLSVAYSGVPIYLPPWWPFSYYNVRYGLQLLPAFAVFVSLAASTSLRELVHTPPDTRSCRRQPLLVICRSWPATLRSGRLRPSFREAWSTPADALPWSANWLTF